MTSVALDTNVLAYAEGVVRQDGDIGKVLMSRRLMRGLLERRVRTIVAVQTLAELHHVLVRRRRLSPAHASEAVRAWIERADIVATAPAIFQAALDLAADHRLPIFDAVILAAAADSRCDLLISEDFQEGFAWRGMVVANPFGAQPDPRLAAIVEAGG